jgi:3D (Asp-Asp-Asp) domain-containing protein
MMLLSRSFARKIVATGTAAVAFAFLYEVTVLDSRYAARQLELQESTATPANGTRLRFTATAYCRGTTTASGVNVRNGIAAADPDLLPVGSVIQVDRLGERYNGIYTVMDTGPAVQGRHIDIYMELQRGTVQFGAARGPDRPPPGWNPTPAPPASSIARFGVANPRNRLLSRRPFFRGVPDEGIGAEGTGRINSNPGGGRSFNRPGRPSLIRTALIQLVVDAPLGQQFLVRADLPELPLVQDEELVHVLDRREAMGNGDGRAPGH